jgi:hypothetical protein
MATFGGANTVTDGLILSLDAANRNSYTSGSTTWNDLVGTTYSGSLITSSSYSSSPDRFDTNCTTITNIGYLSVNQLTFDDQSSYTFDFWVKMRANAQSTFHSLLGRGSTNPWLVINANTTTGLSWDLRFRDNASTYNIFTTISDTNIQSWTNVTITADTSRNLSLYLNGNFRQTITLPSSSLFYVSRIVGGYSSGANQYNFQGSLASCKLYNQTLTTPQIQQNYNSTKGRFNL